MLATIAGICFVLLLLAGVPVLSYLTAQRIKVDSIPRPALYLSAIISQWVLALVGAVVVLAAGPGFAAAGFRAVSAGALVGWMFVLVLVALAALGLWLFLERLGWWPPESELVYLLIPETPGEKLWAVLLLAPTAAFCEEFVYRGYLLAQLSQWLDSGFWGIVLSSVAFGLAHAYQGPSGMLRAGLLGALLAYPVFRLGTLYPSMAAHLLIDALALAWLGPRFLGKKPAL